jgi:hypothetical protein
LGDIFEAVGAQRLVHVGRIRVHLEEHLVCVVAYPAFRGKGMLME